MAERGMTRASPASLSNSSDQSLDHSLVVRHHERSISNAFECTDSLVEGTLRLDLNTPMPNTAAQMRMDQKLIVVVRIDDDFEDILLDPERLSQRQLLRIATATRDGWCDLLHNALATAHAKNGQDQWTAIRPILDEYLSLPVERRTTPNRPRRMKSGVVRGRQITLRREPTKSGYLIHITGPGASEAVVREVIDEVLRLAGPGA